MYSIKHEINGRFNMSSEIYKVAVHDVIKAVHRLKTMTMTMNDNENTLFDHNIQIEITIYKQFNNQIINWSGDYY